ncbi:hypothetical protein JFL43_12265 [Viridibacillus sp. YIM B01967]|uniref:Uncharacterized protein n=1 Tax=Viridibacillus soli TaxID=2798301 RepID=A0ABS1H883_9BACL|nr:hypothetical protein [Viridibacillus soli]MBK3495610.1 hypothetical protein [Viridibacillus soli]
MTRYIIRIPDFKCSIHSVKTFKWYLVHAPKNSSKKVIISSEGKFEERHGIYIGNFFFDTVSVDLTRKYISLHQRKLPYEQGEKNLKAILSTIYVIAEPNAFYFFTYGKKKNR